MTTRFFIDLDGVMADFDKAFIEQFGVDNRELADDAMWEKINSADDFFYNLPVCEGASEFLSWISGSFFDRDIHFLTACPPSQYENVARQKKAWVRDRLDSELLVIPTSGGKAKAQFVQNHGDVLIDDFVRNTNAWTEAGGLAVLHKNFHTTKEILRCVR